jgi:hypothetical protein
MNIEAEQMNPERPIPERCPTTNHERLLLAESRRSISAFSSELNVRY